MHGVDSIKNYIDEGKVAHLLCPTFTQFLQHVNTLRPLLHKEIAEGGDPLVIIDTASAMAHTTRMDHKLGTDPSADLWDARKQYMGEDKNYLTSYNYSTDGMTRAIKNVRAIEVAFDEKGKYQKSPPSPLPLGWTRKTPRMIVNCHEAEQDDVTVGYKKRAPYLNLALYKSLEANCSDMFRLTSTEIDMPFADGRTDANGALQVQYPKDTRFLTLRKNGDCVTKFQVVRAQVDKVPDVIVNPSMRKLWHYLQKKPSMLVLYGPAGAGKTTLAVSELEPVQRKATPIQQEKANAA